MLAVTVICLAAISGLLGVVYFLLRQNARLTTALVTATDMHVGSLLRSDPGIPSAHIEPDRPEAPRRAKPLGL